MSPSVPGVPEHGHCEICQVPVPRGDRFCGSAACDEKHRQNVRDKRKQVYFLVFALAAVLVLSKLLSTPF